MNLRTLLLPYYLQLLRVDVRERDCGDESADSAVIPFYLQLLGCSCGSETAEMNLPTVLLPCYLQLLGGI